VAAAARAGIGGKALTPYLLAELARATDGASSGAIRALALANVRLGAALAQSWERLRS
jgi:pseudouridine-5'-phosphate glycosidase